MKISSAYYFRGIALLFALFLILVLGVVFYVLLNNYFGFAGAAVLFILAFTLKPYAYGYLATQVVKRIN